MPRQSPGCGVALATLSVSVCGWPERSKPAPTLSSASEVMITGWPGVPSTCTVPPMRSSISRSVPEAVSPALAPSSFTTRLAVGLL